VLDRRPCVVEMLDLGEIIDPLGVLIERAEQCA
jgi:hypothetical protein